MNIERMREGLRIIYEECGGHCRGCPFVDGCFMSDGLCTYIGEVAECLLDYGPGGRFHTQKEKAE